MIAKLLVLSGLVVLSGCRWGTRPQNFPPANGPQGATVAVRLVGERHDRVGELFAADTSGIVVAFEASPNLRLARFPWARIRAMDVGKLGSRFDVSPNEQVKPDKIQLLAAVSRFPQGLSGDLLSKVLGRLRQDSLDTPGVVPDLSALVDSAKIATSRYEDRALAIRDGYRRIGTDFPAMGEHWILPAALMKGRTDAERPTMLTYAVIAGRPTLLGIGFIVTTRGDSVPSHLAGWPEYWHEHSGLLSEESGARGTRASRDSITTHVWVLHAWTRLENPGGRYTPNNWTLPFARLGVAPPSDVDADAGSAFSLIVGGDAHLRGVLSAAGLLSASNASAVDATIAASRERVVAVSRAAGPSVSASRAAELKEIWRSMGASLTDAVGPSVDSLLFPNHAHEHSTPQGQKRGQ